MKLLVAVAALLAVCSLAQAIAIPQEMQPLELRRSFKCRACGWLDDAVLVAEDLAGTALEHYLDNECNYLIFPINDVCKKIIKDVVGLVEKYGHKLDKPELCHKLLKAC
ncbi:hypothetical protein L596_023632 [Steinernema carpocapsae]|uniref:Saposin B-type domain-containing protein n=1 Tax=Steinernema carpocapsae TaxID=34508 RepID=A0A4U5MF01_STECR|nr:hypothetical protein L596_023632 [Steinernema carpocapsae]